MKRSIPARIGNRLVYEFRKFPTQFIYCLRRWFPYPRLWARMTGNRVPESCVTGRRARLNRPESVGFSFSGDRMVTSNSGNCSVTVYSKIKNKPEGYYHARPSVILANAGCLNFTHDAVFSPCEKYILAVGRDDHALVQFKLPQNGTHENETQPVALSRGDEYGLCNPTGLSMHPSGRWLAVANRKRFGITVYRRSESTRLFDAPPIQRITEAELVNLGLASPHTLNFSMDGESLVVAHKRFWEDGQYTRGDSALSVFKWREGSDSGLHPNPRVVHPFGDARLHSVAFDPSGDGVAVTHETGGIDLFNLSDGRTRFSKQTTIDIFRINEGPKGIAFTRNGKQLVTTTMLDEVLFFNVP